MITAAQMRAARALLGIDQKTLAELSGLSIPTIQRMESSSGNVRGVVESLTRVITALELAGIELIGEGGCQSGGRSRRSIEVLIHDILNQSATATADDKPTIPPLPTQGAATSESIDRQTERSAGLC